MSARVRIRHGKPRTPPPPAPASLIAAARLPQPTTTRLVQLVVVAAAGAAFAAWWWLVKERDHWPGTQLDCLPGPVPAGRDPMDTVTGFTRCVDGVRLDQALVVLCGPLALLLLALVTGALVRAGALSRRRTRPAGPEMAARLAAVVPEGAAGPPRLLIRRGRGLGLGARADGTVRRPRVIAGAGAHLQPERDIGALFRHEVAHITARDVGRVRIAIAAWWILLAGVTVPLALELAPRPGNIGGAISLRLAVILGVFGLTLCGVLRIREHDADVRAAADPRDGGDMAAYIARDRSPTPRRRITRLLGLATHPTRADRLSALDRPARLWGLSVPESLATGIAAGLVFTDAALLITALTPDSIATGYRITGALTGWAVAGVVTVALWRAAAVRHPDAYGLRPARRGAALGAGVLAGSQLSARAAGDWTDAFGTADGLAADFSLANATAGRAAALTLALIVGGALFTTWAAALARAAGAAPDGPRSGPACAAAVALSGAVLAMPLGTWFLLAALAAVEADSVPYWGAMDSRAWVIGATLTLFGALAPFALTALRRTRPRLRLVPAVAVALFALPTAAAWIPLTASADSSPRRVLFPATVATPKPHKLLTTSPSPPSSPPSPPSPPSGDEPVIDIDDLPVLPPPEAEGREPVRDPFIACLALNAGRSALWADPAGREETAELLAGVDDTVLRAVSAVLRRSHPEPVHSDVPQAAILRCDLLRRYAR
ncbi:M48 family metalloprotease [Streptomyces qinzhouensis]|uniref:M48 family metalloprotease n=1 Tax=Streptomyces qinzhouensis TaxID=2599401 RepID=UPI001648700D|nr:M48 family metalloprotease [Streptomyces qinzhouensis]